MKDRGLGFAIAQYFIRLTSLGIGFIYRLRQDYGGGRGRGFHGFVWLGFFAALFWRYTEFEHALLFATVHDSPKASGGRGYIGEQEVPSHA